MIKILGHDWMKNVIVPPGRTHREHGKTSIKYLKLNIWFGSPLIFGILSDIIPVIQ